MVSHIIKIINHQKQAKLLESTSFTQKTYLINQSLSQLKSVFSVSSNRLFIQSHCIQLNQSQTPFFIN
jgi:hypothetical protein